MTKVHTTQLNKRRKDGASVSYWRLRTQDRHGKWHCRSVGKVSEVGKREVERQRKAWEKELEQAEEQGRPTPAKKRGSAPMTLGVLRQVYPKERRVGQAGRGLLKGSPKLSAGTLREHDMVLRYLVECFGSDQRIDALREADIEGFVEKLAGGRLTDARHKSKRAYTLEQNTLRKHLRSIKAIFSWCVRRGYMPHNPAQAFQGKTLPGAPNPYVPVEVIEQMIDLDVLVKTTPKITYPQGWQALLMLCRLAGLRLTEARLLPWESVAVDKHGQRHRVGVDFEEERIRLVSQKTGEFRIVPLDPKLGKLLREVRDYAPADAETVSQVGAHNLTRTLKNIMVAAEVKPWRKGFQSLRSSCSNDWKQRGVHRTTYSQWAGHSPEVSDDHYVSPTADEFAMITSPSDMEISS